MKGGRTVGVGSEAVAKQEAGPAGKCARPLEPEMNFAASSVVISTAPATSSNLLPRTLPRALLLSYFLSFLSYSPSLSSSSPLTVAVAVALCWLAQL